MRPSERTLSHEQARRFYDRFGARQDTQAAYEDPPNHDVAAHLELGSARALFELGCGTGRLAEHLFEHGLPADARYRTQDVSGTMVELARTRLARFAPRVQVELSDGSMRLPPADASCDRFVSTYVFDLLALADIERLVSEMRRILRPGGLAGMSGLTEGSGALGGLVTWIWKRVYQLSPERVGGCRPLQLAPFFTSRDWEIRHQRTHAWHGLTSEVLVVQRR
jgi:ubiquinone/menaquinone biosynthesis C-methylase UbiE